ncbi:MAG TPA: hypothetical protein VKZ57_03495 [Sphingobacterium sp.]|nr:hypothetical protein [Sphingobacterium sp.]
MVDNGFYGLFFGVPFEFLLFIPALFSVEWLGYLVLCGSYQPSSPVSSIRRHRFGTVPVTVIFVPKTSQAK